MARVLANAYGGKAPAGAEITFESVTVHANMVEVKWTVTDMAFSRLKNAANEMRSSRASAYCDAHDLAYYLNRGVIVHEVFATPNHSDLISFTLNISNCGAPKNPLERFGCTTQHENLSSCAPDDRKCEVLSKMRGCISDDILYRKRKGL
jgi:hypothetical protein